MCLLSSQVNLDFMFIDELTHLLIYKTLHVEFVCIDRKKNTKALNYSHLKVMRDFLRVKGAILWIRVIPNQT